MEQGIHSLGVYVRFLQSGEDVIIRFKGKF